MEPKIRNRLILFSLAIAGLALGIGFRLFQLQILEGETYQKKARRQHENRIKVEATRGAILDRNGEELAVSVQRQSLFAHAWRIDDETAAKAARKLAPILGRDEGPLRELLASDKNFVWLGRTLDPEVEQKVRDLGFTADVTQPFGFKPEPARLYPRGSLAAHVVGFAGDNSGLAGVEYSFDDELSGDPTIYVVQRDAQRGGLTRVQQAPDKKSKDVVLTIDLVLQHIVERELKAAVNSTGAKAASAVLMDPGSGEILALANWPTVDANRFGKGSTAQRTNRAVVHMYEPGSTFKMVPLAAAIERDRIQTTELFFCENGRWKRKKREIRDVSRNGTLSVAEILAKSSNIGMAKITSRLSAQELHETIRAFGFGNKTGLELPGESAGLLRDVDQWSGMSQDSLSFGQEMSATVLQMTSMIATIANDGVRTPPHLVLGLRERSRLSARPRNAPERVIESRTAAELRSMMERVITRGTGKRAGVAGYRLAGKSGTAQMAVPGGYSSTDYMASFGGFGPADDPKLVAMVVLDSPRGHWYHGGQVAAPVFSAIMGPALRHLRVPENADLLPRPELRAAAESRMPQVDLDTSAAVVDRMPDLQGRSARGAVRRLAATGCRIRLDGGGYVVAQDPAPGDPISHGGECSVRLRPQRPDLPRDLAAMPATRRARR